MTEYRPQWPRVVALLAFTIIGTVIGFSCSGGPRMLDRGLSVDVITFTLMGAAAGVGLFAMVMLASRHRNEDR